MVAILIGGGWKRCGWMHLQLLWVTVGGDGTQGRRHRKRAGLRGLEAGGECEMGVCGVGVWLRVVGCLSLSGDAWGYDQINAKNASYKSTKSEVRSSRHTPQRC